MMRRIARMLNASQEGDGYPQNGVLERLQTRRAIAGVTAPMSPGVVAIDLRAKSSLVRPALEIAIGVALTLAAVVWRRRESSSGVRRRDRIPAAGDAVPRRIPPAMLLNLGPLADVADVETAPPLGTRGGVRERVVPVLGSSAVFEDGRATLCGPDWSLALDLGRDDPVWTVTVEARGDGSMQALERLARDTGWRIFIPRLGVFVDPRKLSGVAPPEETA
jgi:hypothetical protein